MNEHYWCGDLLITSNLELFLRVFGRLRGGEGGETLVELPLSSCDYLMVPLFQSVPLFRQWGKAAQYI